MTNGEMMLYGGYACIGLAVILIVILAISGKLQQNHLKMNQNKIEDEVKRELSSLTRIIQPSKTTQQEVKRELVDIPIMEKTQMVIDDDRTELMTLDIKEKTKIVVEKEKAELVNQNINELKQVIEGDTNDLKSYEKGIVNMTSLISDDDKTALLEALKYDSDDSKTKHIDDVC